MKKAKLRTSRMSVTGQERDNYVSKWVSQNCVYVRHAVDVREAK